MSPRYGQPSSCTNRADRNKGERLAAQFRALNVPAVKDLAGIRLDENAERFVISSGRYGVCPARVQPSTFTETLASGKQRRKPILREWFRISLSPSTAPCNVGKDHFNMEPRLWNTSASRRQDPLMIHRRGNSRQSARALNMSAR